MELRQLGQSDLRITPVVLGTWAIGGWMWGSPDDANAIKAIHESIDQGINTLDTAPIYGMGHSETIVGKAIKGKRDKLIIATKCGMRWDSKEGSDPWQQHDLKGNPVVIRRNLKPTSIVKECEDSLKRLGIDVIDLYQIHWPDTTTPLEESWNAMAKLKKQGKVRAIGVCNYDLEQLKTIHAIHPVDSVQPPYSLVRRGIEKDVVPFCKANKIAVIVYSPLERGLLTGKFKAKHTFAKGDHRAEKETFSPRYLAKINRVLDSLSPIAENYRATIAQIIIDCTIHRPGITAALVGARNASQAKENAQGGKLNLLEPERDFIALLLAAPELQRSLYD